MTAAPPSLHVRELSVGYSRRPVIERLSLAPLPAGSVTAIVGPNGAGKSTLLRGLAGLIPAQGAARLGDVDLASAPARVRSRLVGFMPQVLPAGVQLLALETVVAALAVNPVDGARQAGAVLQRRAMAVLARLGVEDLALEPLDALSGGQRQLVSLAQAIAREPTVLLLDEPTSALDLRHQVRVMHVVRELAAAGAIVLVVLHDLGMAARWADRVVALSRGALVAEGRADAVLTPDMLAKTYGVAARIERCSAGHLQVIVDGLAERPAGPLSGTAASACCAETT